jgi:hypothetical protein
MSAMLPKAEVILSMERLRDGVLPVNRAAGDVTRGALHHALRIQRLRKEGTVLEVAYRMYSIARFDITPAAGSRSRS